MTYGIQTYWRFKKDGGEWRVGYPARTGHYNMVRMAPWNGGFSGPVVSLSDIEYKQ